MARPAKQGLDYFPVDVDVSQDPAIQYLQVRYGLAGFAVYLKLLEIVYRDEGYYAAFGPIERAVFAHTNGLLEAELNEIIDTMFEVALFNRNLYEAHAILTSRGIQARFVEITKRRKDTALDLRFDLVSATETLLDEGFCGVIAAETLQKPSNNPTKERKEKRKKTPSHTDSQVGTGPPVDNVDNFQGEEGFEIDDPDPPPLLIGPDNVTVERFGALHAAIAVKFGDLEAARTTPAVLDAIRSTCRSDCRGLHCRSCAIDPAIERVHHTKHPSKLAEFVRKELAG